MGAGYDVLKMPLKVGMAPIRKLGEVASAVASPTSSIALAERLQREAASDRARRDVETAIALGQVLRSRLAVPYTLSPTEQKIIENELEEAQLRIGGLILEAAGDHPGAVSTERRLELEE